MSSQSRVIEMLRLEEKLENRRLHSRQFIIFVLLYMYVLYRISVSYVENTQHRYSHERRVGICRKF